MLLEARALFLGGRSGLGVDPVRDAERALRERLAPLMEHGYRSPEVEELEVRVDATRPEGLQDGVLVLQSASLERLQLVAEALSKSVLLAHYEARLAADFDRKLELVARAERTLVDLMSTRHALRVEWYIVALIAFEILLTLYGMWRV